MTVNDTTTKGQAYMPLPAATKLRRLVEDPNAFLMCPGVYFGYSARIALQVSFDGLYMLQPLASWPPLSAPNAAQAEMTASFTSDPNISPHPSSPIPLISDADTGYDGPIMVSRTVQQHAQSGIAGLHIEDQVRTKRCGHLAGKDLVDTETYESRIRAAVQARKRIGSDIVIIARTDALQPYGYNEAISRLCLARVAGVDVAFLEGITSREETRKVVNDLAPMPCLLNMVEHGATPSTSAGEAKEMGVKIIIFPFVALAPAYSVIKPSMEKLKSEECLSIAKEMTPQALSRICGVEKDMRVDADAGGKSYEGGID